MRSTMKQERLVGLTKISIEREISRSLNCDQAIDIFAAKKARKRKI